MILEREKQMLSAFIKEKGLRKTPERFAILEKVAEYKGLFTVEDMYDYMRKKNFPVSRSTLYNTLELFIECNLVERHIFNTNLAYYERKFNKEPHNYQICTVCGKITKHRNRDLNRQLKHIGFRGFKVESYQLNLYGICKKCQRLAKEKNEGKGEK